MMLNCVKFSKVKKIITWSIALMGIILPALAQPDAPAKPRKTSKKKTLLWEVSGNGLSKPSYIFGTMHRLCKEGTDLSPAMQKVIADVDQIYFELDMDNMAELMGGLQFMKMKKGLSLSKLLSKEDYDRLKVFYDKMKPGLPFSMVEGMLPMLTAQMIGDAAMDCKDKTGMEEVIMNEARKTKKEIKGLETMKFQAAVFDSIPYELQARELMKYVDSASYFAAVSKRLSDAYLQQDLKKISQLMNSSDNAILDYMDMLLYSRNRNWVVQLKNLMSQNKLLIAVGAGHLPGEQGVLELLKKEGYKVKPVRN